MTSYWRRHWKRTIFVIVQRLIGGDFYYISCLTNLIVMSKNVSKQKKILGKYALNKISVINCLKLLKIQIINNFQTSQYHLIRILSQNGEKKLIFSSFFSTKPKCSNFTIIRILAMFASNSKCHYPPISPPISDINLNL